MSIKCIADFRSIPKRTDEILGLSTDREFVPLNIASECQQFKETVKTIREMLERDNMKVVFFGRLVQGFFLADIEKVYAVPILNERGQ